MNDLPRVIACTLRSHKPRHCRKRVSVSLCWYPLKSKVRHHSLQKVHSLSLSFSTCRAGWLALVNEFCMARGLLEYVSWHLVVSQYGQTPDWSAWKQASPASYWGEVRNRSPLPSRVARLCTGLGSASIPKCKFQQSALRQTMLSLPTINRLLYWCALPFRMEAVLLDLIPWLVAVVAWNLCSRCPQKPRPA